jgi:cysteine desulfurase/selenocysteine lyase
MDISGQLGTVGELREARRLFPATQSSVYLNTAAVGLAAAATREAYRAYVDDWTASGLDYVRGEAAANACRASVAQLIGTPSTNVALISSVSAMAGLIASQFGPASPGQNLVVGEREYTSNLFPWLQLRSKGYEVRLVPFRNGGVEPDALADHVDAGTQLVSVSAVQSATGHRTDMKAISAIARDVGALVFVDGSQLLGAMSIVDDLPHIDVLAAPDHKFLMNAGRGMGYLYLSPAAQDRFTPTSAGWKAGRVPMESFYGPTMDLSPTASRFDQSISWLAAIGNEAALSVFDTFGADAIYRRNAELAELLRVTLSSAGWHPVDLPPENRSTIVSVPIRNRDAAEVVDALKARGIVCAAREGNLRVSVHFYNHEDDITSMGNALDEL